LLEVIIFSSVLHLGTVRWTPYISVKVLCISGSQPGSFKFCLISRIPVNIFMNFWTSWIHELFWAVLNSNDVWIRWSDSCLFSIYVLLTYIAVLDAFHFNLSYFLYCVRSFANPLGTLRGPYGSADHRLRNAAMDVYFSLNMLHCNAVLLEI